ncbi:CCR4-NOT transcription complex subunit 3 [Anopheles nili]|uniref:CCR4-NOT transcription complex subunit 3 n=1 Tax=Anopheles nili TaxID=185578 RepID=UPI00237B7852|nr:CCR4-NOT transcription complex subunit 3 [Anopheles nili]
MAATRKLQGEIDRCLKKVTEGVETFEDIWQKVHNATNSNQKEKYEADLKKEIKKLQRLRDQIKSWIASGEIKDKSALLENRRLIETQMERFKVVERETKTKAYSKEGLGAAQKMDPAQREKEEISSWLTSSITSLQIQIDQFECEIESLLAGKKKKLDKDKQDKMDDLKNKLERHKFHVTKLETLLRMLDNDGVEVEQIKKIKEDVEYYIDSSQEPDFEENEFIYDDIIGLDDVEISGIPVSTGTDSNNSNETAGSPSSLISGTSPAQSPVLNYSASTLHNHSSDLSADNNNLNEKRSKSEGTKITPVKPTAIRASKVDPSVTAVSNAVNNNGSSNSTSSSSSNSNNSSKTGLISSTPSKNHANAAAALPSMLVLPQPPNSIPIIGPAFAAVAKQHPKNGSLLQPSTPTTATGASATSATGSLQTQASNASNAFSSLSQIINASQPKVSQQLQQQQQQQQQQAQNSLPSAAAVVAAASSSSVSSTTQANATSQQQQQAQQQQQQQAQQQSQQIPPGQNSMLLHNALSSASSTESNNHVMSTSSASTISSSGANVINNCVSPSNSAVSSRASPSLMSPPQQQQQQLLNGPTTLAQEVINRTGVLETGPSSNPNTLMQQQNPQGATPVTVATSAAQQVAAQAAAQAAAAAAAAQAAATAAAVAGQQLQHSQQQQQQQQQQQPQSADSRQAGPVPSNPSAQSQSGGPAFMVDASGVPTGAATGNLLPTSSATAITNGPNTIINTNSSISNAANVNSGTGGVMKATAGTHEACIPPLLGVAPLGTSKLQKEHQIQFQLMEAAYYHLPTPSDSERLRPYLQRQPVQTPPHFPQQQLPHSETVEFFQRLSPETLFFVFYYMEGTKAQYLAAKALKKQSWRFHTKYMMWFQRHEEPKVINEEYEQGTYIYFDYEKWGQRKKEGFTFEYKYLEDRDLN